jgi:hypothetical protein
MVKNPSGIKNKAKRQAVFQKYKAQKKSTKKALKRERLKEAEELGADAPPKQVNSNRNAPHAICCSYRIHFHGIHSHNRSQELLKILDYLTKQPSLLVTARCSAMRKTTSSPSTTPTRRYLMMIYRVST